MNTCKPFLKIVWVFLNLIFALAIPLKLQVSQDIILYSLMNRGAEICQK